MDHDRLTYIAMTVFFFFFFVFFVGPGLESCFLVVVVVVVIAKYLVSASTRTSFLSAPLHDYFIFDGIQ